MLLLSFIAMNLRKLSSEMAFIGSGFHTILYHFLQLQSIFFFLFTSNYTILKKQEYFNASGYVFPYLCIIEIIAMGLYLGTAALGKTEG